MCVSPLIAYRSRRLSVSPSTRGYPPKVFGLKDSSGFYDFCINRIFYIHHKLYSEGSKMKWFKPFTFFRQRNQPAWDPDDLKEKAPMLHEVGTDEPIKKRRVPCLSRSALAWLPHVFLLATYIVVFLTWPMSRPSKGYPHLDTQSRYTF